MNNLAQDQKRFRRLRKALRQIENLNLLQRNLNQEEKQKISKRSLFREELKQLFEKYPNGELLSYDSRENTFETEESIISSGNAPLQNENSFEIHHLTDKLNQIELKEADDIQINSTPEIQFLKSETSETNYFESSNQCEDLCVDQQKVKTESLKAKDQIKLLKIASENHQVKKKDFTFDTITVTDAHQDLITCVDIDGKNELVVTGSRDTSIKIWKFSSTSKVCELSKTFGEHSSLITQVKFWNSNDYKSVLENLKLNQNENEDLIDSLIELNDESPLIISSSLDCSLRLWSTDLFKCIKEFYLYNPIKCFDTKNSYLVIGQDAGKIQLWKNFKQVAVLKQFEDTDNVVCVKFEGENKIYALSQNGYFKILIYNNQDLHEKLEIDVLENVKNISSVEMTRNFKQFEILDTNNLIFLNDNQSFIIEHNLENNQSSLISTNQSSYAFSSCFFKNVNSNLVYVSSFNIDNAKSFINVFEKSTKLDYLHSIEDLDQDLSISAISSSDMSSNTGCVCVSTVAGSTLKIFLVDKSGDILVPSRLNKVKILKMMQKFELKNHSFIDSNDESDQDDHDDETTEQIETQEKKSTCSIQ